MKYIFAIGFLCGLTLGIALNPARAEIDLTDINVSEYDYDPDYDYLDPDSITAEEKQKLAEFWDNIVIEG